MNKAHEMDSGPWVRAAARASGSIFMLILMVGPSVLSGIIGFSFIGSAQVSDWVIETPGVTLDDQTKTMTKSIIVESGGELIVRNSTIIFNLTSDGAAGIYVRSGGSLEIYDSRVDTKDAIRSPRFSSEGTLRIARSTFRGLYGQYQQGGGVIINGGEAHVMDSMFEKNRRQGMTVVEGQVSIQRNTFRDNSEGVMCKDIGGVLIEDNKFEKQTQHGIVGLNSVLIIRRNTFSDNSIGIGLSTTQANIKDNDIKNNRVGIDVVSSHPVTIDMNKIMSNTDTGVRASSSNIIMTQNEISSNSVGLNITGGLITINSNTILGNDHGIIAVAAMGDISLNIIGGSTDYGIYMIGGTLNVGSNDFSPQNSLGRVAYAWSYQVIVNKGSKDEPTPVNGADVELFDKDGETVFYGVTNSTGKSRTIEVVQKAIDNTGTEVSYTPHKLKVKYKSLRGSESIEMTENQTTTVWLKSPKASTPFTPQILMGIGIVLLAVSAGLFLNWKYGGSSEGGREPRIKREARSRRRRSRGSLTSTRDSRSMRARRRRHHR